MPMARRAVQVNQNFLNVGHNKQTFMRDALLTKLESRVKHHVSMFVSIWQAPGRLPPSLEEGLERVRNRPPRRTARHGDRARRTHRQSAARHRHTHRAGAQCIGFMHGSHGIAWP